MAKQSKTIEIIPLSKITPDPNQPRKNFDPGRLGDLMRSIEKHGIINPLHVESVGNGYLLVDGERRFRAATELKLKDVPAIITSAQQPVDRLIQQFHLQEQHEGWSAAEKATAVANLAKQLGLSIKEIGRLLAIPERTIGTYIGFAELIERREFEKNEFPISFAEKIVRLRAYARMIFEKYGEEFTKDDERSLERAIIARLKSGDIRKGTDLNKIRDAMKTDPDTFRKFLKNDKISVQKLFLDADAAVAHHYRNSVYSAHAIEFHINKGLELGMKKYLEEDPDAVAKFRRAYNAIEGLIGRK